MEITTDHNNKTITKPSTHSILNLFEEIAEKSPEELAVIFESKKYTYKSINEQANQLANFLVFNGVKVNVLVGIYIERSVEMVIGLLAILKAGGAYVPLDPNYPTQRIHDILENTDIAVILTQDGLSKKLNLLNQHIICIDKDWSAISEYSYHNLSLPINPLQLIYVIYTSGSTGKPKGVMNTHNSIVNRLLWMQTAYQFTKNDKILQKTPFCFDVSVWEIFLPLICGASMVVAKPEGHRDSIYLSKLIVEQKITALHFVPSMLGIFLEDLDNMDFNNVRHVFCSGEMLSQQIVTKFFSIFKNTQLHNLYGPTEAAIDVSYYKCDKKELKTGVMSVPIGTPITNTQLYVLNSSLQPVSSWEEGDLYIGGINLARGYLNQPELTADKFIPDPFNPEPGLRLYKTGDLARDIGDGNIEFLGRVDQQVKINGVRIELGEIETALLQLGNVKRCVITAKEAQLGIKYLVAYVVLSHDAAIDDNDLLKHLQTTLPYYMIPSIVIVPSIPLSINGKIDYKALDAMENSNVILKENFIAPSSDTQIILASIWQEVLSLSTVSLMDNFFKLGGNSLQAMQVISALKNKLGVELSMSIFFENPTLKDLSEEAIKIRVLSAKDEEEFIALISELSEDQMEELINNFNAQTFQLET